MLLVADSVVDVASGCEVSVLEEFAECDGCVVFALVVLVPHSCNDLLCSQELFLGEGPPVAMDGYFVVLFDEFIVYPGG